MAGGAEGGGWEFGARAGGLVGTLVEEAGAFEPGATVGAEPVAGFGALPCFCASAIPNSSTLVLAERASSAAGKSRFMNVERTSWRGRSPMADTMASRRASADG